MENSSTTFARKPRVLFCSYHSYIDPGSGAALSTRDLLEWLARHGWHCRVFSGAEFDGAEGGALPALLAAQQVPYDVQHGHAGSLPFALYHFTQGGVPVAVYQAPDVQPGRTPTPAEGQTFLTLFERMLDAFRPDVLLTFGGHWFAPIFMQRARQRGVRVVFCLKNCNYHSAELFRETDAVLVLSEYCREHYRRTLGLECTVLPSLIDETRVRSPSVQGRYVTFVNPLPHKGAAVFARIAHELGRRRPDIPLLVVESRAKATALQAAKLDFGGRTNLFVMEQTPDPRDFSESDLMAPE